VAQDLLGILYGEGKGVAQSWAEAAKWHRRAADKGPALAQHDLGDLYDQGNGVAEEKAEAFNWFLKAARQDDAIRQFNLVRQKDVREWRRCAPEHP
jgi:TPR repeat protein